MATENSRVLWSERTTGASIVTTELNALADDTAVLSTAAGLTGGYEDDGVFVGAV